MDSIIIDVRGEPVGKAAKVGTGKHTHLPKKTRNWMDTVSSQAQLVAPPIPLDCPIRVEIVARFSIPKSASKWWKEAALAGVIRPTKKPDYDNIEKGIGDALSGVIWRDDALVVSGRCEKVYSETPGVRITITPLSEPLSAADWAWTRGDK
uniref:Putative endodeoxyribonuclease n=1 Tax=viral metagenome TaxID=1070528 RepID=A0A6M3LAW8_9ZZZZ